MIEGRITRVSGPIIYAEGLEACGLYDVVDAGDAKLIGEIIRQKNGLATIQVYEDDTGMKVGEKVICHQRPLSVRLGPGLVGTIYDGIQRPLKEMYELSGAFLLPGQRLEPLNTQKKWLFIPLQEAPEGTPVCTPISPGMVIGTVQETESVEHKIMISPSVKGRTLIKIAPKGEYTINDVIGETELGEQITLAHYWPVRKPRPFAQKLTVSEPLITGQRIIDVFFPL
ncbi:MAG TPA: V-type ATP synthase subunit A, partial [Treponemataceae bacterium]|nr:V-type ATP synthase subunit A [Treponemataceae bacterium]